MMVFGTVWILSEIVNYLNLFGLQVRHGFLSLLSLKILITGGLGFVGGRLAYHLLQQGHKVVIGSRNKKILPILLNRAEIVEIDYENQDALENICCETDVIIHAAGMNSQACVENSAAALKFNGEITSRLVKAANLARVSRFIYLSTAHVYSSPLIGIINEETLTKNPHPYATSNLVGENSVISICSLGETEGIVFRLSNTFGYPVVKNSNCWSLLLNDLCRQAVETRELTLQSSGLEERDFIGLSSVCNIVEYFVINQTIIGQGSIFNIGSGISYSILEVLAIVQNRCLKVLGFSPGFKPLHQSLANSSRTELKFNIDKLISLDIKINKNEVIEEIDNLLLYCQKEFNKAEGL